MFLWCSKICVEVKTRLIERKYWGGTFFFSDNDVAMKPRWSRPCAKSDKKLFDALFTNLQYCSNTKVCKKIKKLSEALLIPAILLVARIRHPWSSFSNGGFLRRTVSQPLNLSNWTLFWVTLVVLIGAGVALLVLIGTWVIVVILIGTAGPQRWGGEAAEDRGRVWNFY